MKVIGGIVAALGVLFILNSVATYFWAGRIHEQGAWGGFGTIVAVGLTVIALGVRLFVGKRPDDGSSDGE